MTKGIYHTHRIVVPHLNKEIHAMTQLNAAGVPPALTDVFEKAQEQISRYFSNITPMPEKGRIEIDGIRFMWAQAEGLAVAFRNSIIEIYGEKGAEQILYRFGQSLGKNEAAVFHERFGITDPLEQFSYGPIYFAYSGWAFVDILPSSNPRQDEDYILTYNHPGAFEAEALIKNGITGTRPVCHINTGYSSGWCGRSYDLPLEAREITCKAAGGEHCTFIMAHRNRILELSEKMQDLLKSKKPHEITTGDLR